MIGPLSHHRAIHTNARLVTPCLVPSVEEVLHGVLLSPCIGLLQRAKTAGVPLFLTLEGDIALCQSEPFIFQSTSRYRAIILADIVNPFPDIHSSWTFHMLTIEPVRLQDTAHLVLRTLGRRHRTPRPECGLGDQGPVGKERGRPISANSGVAASHFVVPLSEG